MRSNTNQVCLVIKELPQPVVVLRWHVYYKTLLLTPLQGLGGHDALAGEIGCFLDTFENSSLSDLLCFLISPCSILVGYKQYFL